MLKNLLTTALRNFKRNKLHSYLNLIGLTIGISASLLIAIWVRDEFSHNTGFKNYKSIVRVLSSTTINGETATEAGIAAPLADQLRSSFTNDYKYISLVSDDQSDVLSTPEKNIESLGIWVEQEFPTMFSLHLNKGNAYALKDPSAILICQSLAERLFVNGDAINRTIRLNNSFDLKVSGIFKDFPDNSGFTGIEFLLPWHNTQNAGPESSWTNHHYNLYAELNRPEDFDKISNKIKNITKPFLNGRFSEELQLQHISDANLYTEFENGKVTGKGHISIVRLFGFIGLLIILLACINYMNMSTARSFNRAKEVGIRKVLGSLRWSLIKQFLMEALAFTVLAFILALLVDLWLLPYFNTLSNKQMAIPWTDPLFLIFSCLFILLTSLVSGSYPSFYLSGFKPVKVLKGKIKAGKFQEVPRKVLVIVQFSVSVTLIISTIVIFQQVQYAQRRPLGYRPFGLISIVMNTPEIRKNYDALRNDLLATGAVENMTESSSPTTNVQNSLLGFSWKGKDPQSTPVFGTIGVTHDFGKTLGWNLKDGRDFSRDFPADTGSLILNESAVKQTGFKHPVGETIQYDGKDREIIGVVGDLVMESPYKKASPTIFVLGYDWVNYITIRLNSTLASSKSISLIERVFKKYNPGSPFEYQFTLDEYSRKFQEEQRTSQLIMLFTILANIISCLGLFGLASYMAEQKTREFGIRKILGASIFNLWNLITKEFVGLILISLIIASPVALYFLNSWLQSFEYRIQISFWVFSITAIIILFVTLITVSLHTFKAASVNPVKNLNQD